MNVSHSLHNYRISALKCLRLFKWNQKDAACGLYFCCAHTHLGLFTQDVFLYSAWSWDAFLRWHFLSQFNMQNPLCISLFLLFILFSCTANLSISLPFCLSGVKFRGTTQSRQVRSCRCSSLSINCLYSSLWGSSETHLTLLNIFFSPALILSRGKGQIAGL